MNRGAGSFDSADAAEVWLRDRLQECGYNRHAPSFGLHVAADVLESSRQYVARLARAEGFPAIRPKGEKGNWLVTTDGLACWLAGQDYASPLEYWRDGMGWLDETVNRVINEGQRGAAE